METAAKYQEFQSRKQDYFNWKYSSFCLSDLAFSSFSPASRIILIERLLGTVNKEQR